MANKLIPEELDALIQEYLTDGILTPKEREVILKKAEKMNLDREEMELYLDAQIQKIEQATDAAERKKKGKLCPYCYKPIPQLAEKCPFCEEIITPEASKELQEILDNLEEALVALKSGKDIERSKATVERYARKAKLYYSNNPKIKPLLEEVQIEMLEAENNAKSRQRKETAKSILTNSWVWCSLPIVVGFIFIVIANTIADDDGMAQFGTIIGVIGLMILMVRGAKALSDSD